MSKSCVRFIPRLPERARWRGIRAFTLVEIGVVTLIIGLLATLAVPQLKKTIITTRSTTVINDLRVFSQAFTSYLHDKGDWPPEQATAGKIPTGMVDYLRQSNWERITPIGGYYNWEKNQKHNSRTVRAAIVISTKGLVKVTSDRAQLQDIDRKFDDGNLATGNFLLGSANAPLYIIEP
jgi:type II secretory pathway pseudopilin PulG